MLRNPIALLETRYQTLYPVMRSRVIWLLLGIASIATLVFIGLELSREVIYYR